VIPVASEVERAVVEILRERGGRATLRELAVELHRRGYSPRSAHGALYYLAVKGLVSDPLPASPGGLKGLPRAVCRISARTRTHHPFSVPILGASPFQTAGARLPGE